RDIREELNQRLQDGEEGRKLAAWLNGLPEVKEVLEERFGGRPINEVNLTEWRQGGFLDWERHEEARTLVGSVAERAGDFDAEANGAAIADQVAAILAVELTLHVEAVRRETSDPKERWERLRGLLRELTQLRREDHRATRVASERERWQAEVDRRVEEQMERERKAQKAKVMAPIFAAAEANELAKVLGGGEEAREVAGAVIEVQHDLRPGTLTKRPAAPAKGWKEAVPKPKPRIKRSAKKEADAPMPREGKPEHPSPVLKEQAGESTDGAGLEAEQSLPATDGAREPDGGAPDYPPAPGRDATPGESNQPG